MTKLDNLIKIIDQEIKNTEEMDISYKEKEMNILEDITSKETFMNPYNEKQNENNFRIKIDQLCIQILNYFFY